MKAQKHMKNYRQSERLDLYQKYIDQLLAEGKPTKSYVTEEELATERERQKQLVKHLATLTNTLV